MGVDADDDQPGDYLLGGLDGHPGHGCPSGRRSLLVGRIGQDCDGSGVMIRTFGQPVCGLVAAPTDADRSTPRRHGQS